MKTKRLHILTPSSNQTPDSLVGEGIGGIGDLIADLRHFPPMAYEVNAEQTCLDITSDLFTMPDYWTVAREWVIQFTEQTGLQDLLAIDGYSFWWPLNSLKFVPVLSDLGNSFSWIDLLDAIYKRARPDSVVVHGQHKALVNLARQIYEGLEFQIRPEAAARRRAKARPSRTIGLLLARIIMAIVYLIYSLFRRPAVCFFANTNHLRKTTVGARQELRDVYLGQVAQAVQARGWRTTIVEKYEWNASWRGLVKRGFFFPNDVIFLLSMPALYKLGLYRRTVRKWHKKWQQARPNLIAHLHYRGYDLVPLALPLLADEFARNGPGLEIMTKMWRRILTVWRPRLLYINCYYGRSAITAIIAAKSLNIPTIEQQHGVIGKNFSAYLVPRNIKARSEFPLCDAIVTWGEYTKRLLVDAGVYEPEQVAVCGFPRIDSLLGELAPRSQTLTQLGIPPNRQVVLYASSMIAQGVLPEILDSIQDVPDSSKAYWIIKLHPREKTRHVWETALKQRQLQTVRVVEGKFDFYALLAACDIHVSFISTTLIEAAILGKLNLGLDLAQVPDPVGYTDAKAFLPVAPHRLGPTVCQMLSNSVQKETLLREQKKFAEDWCLHDGKATQRIVRLIEATIAASNRTQTNAGGKDQRP